MEALAAVLTGWSVDRDTGQVVLRREAHEPGVKSLVGTDYEGLPPDHEVPVVMEALARPPSTAKHLATKLVRHFVADDPPSDAVEALAALWIRTDGDLDAVAKWLVDSEYAWSQPMSKVKSPWDYLVSAGRALGLAEDPGSRRSGVSLQFLGQQTWAAPSPAGWPDVAADWVASEALMRRIDFAHELARYAGTHFHPRDRAEDILGSVLSGRTRSALDRVGRGPLGVALWLSSPDFQRR